MIKVGFMQGRLCAPVDGKIQAFPWQDWETEFAIAQSIDMHLMEWTLDQERLHENPLMTEDGRQRIRELAKYHGVEIHSLTGDCFMQAPFFKSTSLARQSLTRDLHAIIDACSLTGIRLILIPLVDNGSLETREQENILVETLKQITPRLLDRGTQIVFESDFPPGELARFISRLPAASFGINYDIGNSAALGFDPIEEFHAYGNRILNVHVKDRRYKGITTPLGTGDANFPSVFSSLHECKYHGNFILQTARANDGDHSGAIARYRDMVENWWQDYGS